jgi:hypothetical protein
VGSTHVLRDLLAATSSTEAFDQEEPFAAIIRCTADPAKVDKRTRSKWNEMPQSQRSLRAF